MIKNDAIYHKPRVAALLRRFVALSWCKCQCQSSHSCNRKHLHLYQTTALDTISSVNPIVMPTFGLLYECYDLIYFIPPVRVLGCNGEWDTLRIENLYFAGMGGSEGGRPSATEASTWGGVKRLFR